MGRQPWIVRGLMRTADAVTASYKAALFWLFTIVYVFSVSPWSICWQ
jgi:cytochrome d ubiquinol oxidase subunit I